MGRQAINDLPNALQFVVYHFRTPFEFIAHLICVGRHTLGIRSIFRFQPTDKPIEASHWQHIDSCIQLVLLRQFEFLFCLVGTQCHPLLDVLPDFLISFVWRWITNNNVIYISLIVVGVVFTVLCVIFIEQRVDHSQLQWKERWDTRINANFIE